MGLHRESPSRFALSAGPAIQPVGPSPSSPAPAGGRHRPSAPCQKIVANFIKRSQILLVDKSVKPGDLRPHRRKLGPHQADETRLYLGPAPPADCRRSFLSPTRTWLTPRGHQRPYTEQENPLGGKNSVSAPTMSRRIQAGPPQTSHRTAAAAPRAQARAAPNLAS